ncbi:MAG: hypothetical protein NTX45_24015 [Proteobacteria bacterium]|nr:hypothetical protein [Pseudomonadota bacterium]
MFEHKASLRRETCGEGGYNFGSIIVYDFAPLSRLRPNIGGQGDPPYVFRFKFWWLVHVSFLALGSSWAVALPPALDGISKMELCIPA